MELVLHVLSEVSSISLPFGFSFGVLIIFLWSLPLLPKFFKSIF